MNRTINLKRQGVRIPLPSHGWKISEEEKTDGYVLRVEKLNAVSWLLTAWQWHSLKTSAVLFFGFYQTTHPMFPGIYRLPHQQCHSEYGPHHRDPLQQTDVQSIQSRLRITAEAISIIIDAQVATNKDLHTALAWRPDRNRQARQRKMIQIFFCIATPYNLWIEVSGPVQTYLPEKTT